MASYCAKCGTELSPDKQRCPTCGAPAGSAGAGSVSPIVPPARSGNSALKIILIVVAVFVALGILGVGAVGYMFWRVAHNVRVSDNGQHVSLSGPGGSLDLAAETPSASELARFEETRRSIAGGASRCRMRGNSSPHRQAHWDDVWSE